MDKPNKCGLQEIAFNHSWDTEINNFVMTYIKNFRLNLVHFFVNEATVSFDYPLRFRMN